MYVCREFRGGSIKGRSAIWLVIASFGCWCSAIHTYIGTSPTTRHTLIYTLTCLLLSKRTRRKSTKERNGENLKKEYVPEFYILKYIHIYQTYTNIFKCRCIYKRTFRVGLYLFRITIVFIFPSAALYVQQQGRGHLWIPQQYIR